MQELLEAFQHRREYLRTASLTLAEQSRHEDRLHDLLQEAYRMRYALPRSDREKIVVGACSRSGCGASLFRVGQQFCSTRCRVAAHRALKRSLRRAGGTPTRANLRPKGGGMARRHASVVVAGAPPEVIVPSTAWRLVEAERTTGGKIICPLCRQTGWGAGWWESHCSKPHRRCPHCSLSFIALENHIRAIHTGGVTEQPGR